MVKEIHGAIPSTMKKKNEIIEKYTLMLLIAGLLRSFNFLSISDKVFLASAFTSTPPSKTSKAIAKIDIIILLYILALCYSQTNKHNTMIGIRTFQLKVFKEGRLA